MRSRLLGFPTLVCGVLLTAGVARAEERSFGAGSLVIPMDLEYQDEGIYQAYGLVFQLLRQGVRVSWVIDPDKTWHDTPCDTPGDECPWDCGEEGSGIKCSYPTGSPDFYAGAEVLWGSLGAAPGATISNHGYRGGPFVIDADSADDALPIIDAWNDPDRWADNEWAARSEFSVVAVHEASSDFTGYVKKELVAAPTVGVFADGNETIATEYLRTAGIKQSNGAEFPAASCGADACGPGTDNPDLLTVPSIMGTMGTCDEPNYDHKNGALFTEDGLPAYCQIMSMHWDVNDREKVECGGGACPETPEECAGEPITYHGHEVVAEVREFLEYPTHFFAECQAVNAYENTVPNPNWPYLDDDGRMGHYLTTTGEPPPCPCEPGPDEGEFECVVDGCGTGQDCCLPKDDKERGAGFLIADSPNPFQILRPDVPYMQFDGLFNPVGGSEPAYNLSTFLGTEYKNDRDVTFITALDGPGVRDVWMTGYLDGACDINDDPIIIDIAEAQNEPSDSCGGKVSYLGGHDYTGKEGQRLFLNALFEADCMTAAGQPSIETELTGDLLWVNGDVVVAAPSVPVEKQISIGYENVGAGAALDAVLNAAFAGGDPEIVEADEAEINAGTATWELGSVSGVASQPGDPPSSGVAPMLVRYSELGDYPLSVSLSYRVGVSTHQAPPGDYTIRVLLDSDDDGMPDELDPYPEDPELCGDSRGNGCDDCWTGTYDPSNDQCDGGSVDDRDAGVGSGADGTGNSGCGCRTGSGGGSALLVGLVLLYSFLRRRRPARAVVSSLNQ